MGREKIILYLWKPLSLGFLLPPASNSSNKPIQVLPSTTAGFLFFLFLSAPIFRALLSIPGFMYWLWYTVGLSRGFSTSLDFLSCFTAFSCPPTHSSVCCFDLVALAAWSKRFSMWESNVTHQVCPRLSPLGEGTGLILPFFNSRLKLNLKGKLLHEAMSPVMCTPLLQGIPSVSRNTSSSSGKSGGCWWD